MSRQLLGWVVTSVLLSGSIPATLAAEESSVEPVVSETVVAPGSGDEGCCPSCFCPRWTASADLSSWTGSAASIKRSLKECRATVAQHPGTEALNSNDFQQGFRRWTEGRLDSPRR